MGNFKVEMVLIAARFGKMFFMVLRFIPKSATS